MDASLFIWAAAKRCGKEGLAIKCEIDVSSAIKSVISMSNVILNAMSKCEVLQGVHKECGIQASKLTEYAAGLSAAVGDAAQKCPAPKPGQATGLGSVASPVMCTVNLKDTAKNLFKAVKALLTIKTQCDGADSKACASNALQLLASLAGMGEYLAGAVGECQRATGKSTEDTRPELCAQAVQALVAQTAKVSEAGIGMSTKCRVEPAMTYEPARLYEPVSVKAKGRPVTFLLLGAFLPITAFVGYSGGRSYASHRLAVTERSRGFMSDLE
jgi:hypothetical protein